MTQNALEEAVAVQARAQNLPRDLRVIDAKMLNDYGIFSKRHIADICDLPMWVVEKHVDKSTKVGGNFNPGTLSLMLDFQNEYRATEHVNHQLLDTILALGTSVSFAARLLNIPKSTMQYWVR